MQANQHPFDPENLRIRALLMARLRQIVRSRQLTQVEAAKWLHVSQSRVSHLVNDQANRFSTDTLINMLASAGVQLSVAFEPRQHTSTERGRTGTSCEEMPGGPSGTARSLGRHRQSASCSSRSCPCPPANQRPHGLRRYCCRISGTRVAPARSRRRRVAVIAADRTWHSGCVAHGRRRLCDLPPRCGPLRLPRSRCSPSPA
jgi:predicted XRE-type DNA-binding protein